MPERDATGNRAGWREVPAPAEMLGRHLCAAERTCRTTLTGAGGLMSGGELSRTCEDELAKTQPKNLAPNA